MPYLSYHKRIFLLLGQKQKYICKERKVFFSHLIYFIHNTKRAHRERETFFFHSSFIIIIIPADVCASCNDPQSFKRSRNSSILVH